MLPSKYGFPVIVLSLLNLILPDDVTTIISTFVPSITVLLRFPLGGRLMVHNGLLSVYVPFGICIANEIVIMPLAAVTKGSTVVTPAFETTGTRELTILLHGPQPLALFVLAYIMVSCKLTTAANCVL